MPMSPNTIRQQIITLANTDPDLYHHMVLLAHDKLIGVINS